MNASERRRFVGSIRGRGSWLGFGICGGLTFVSFSLQVIRECTVHAKQWVDKLCASGCGHFPVPAPCFLQHVCSPRGLQKCSWCQAGKDASVAEGRACRQICAGDQLGRCSSGRACAPTFRLQDSIQVFDCTPHFCVHLSSMSSHSAGGPHGQRPILTSKR